MGGAMAWKGTSNSCLPEVENAFLTRQTYAKGFQAMP